jgi:hypothetical protein
MRARKAARLVWSGLGAAGGAAEAGTAPGAWQSSCSPPARPLASPPASQPAAASHVPLCATHPVCWEVQVFVVPHHLPHLGHAERQRLPRQLLDTGAQEAARALTLCRRCRQCGQRQLLRAA